ncbi:putative ATP-binding protein 1 [Elsinoe australis]|uniref:Putative ATP-binding protein 1 n=1 Tax=Elsinoe australis TaxID=40998 RepID=A0A4U7B6L9_9PEZI|nr:putative ATP-binding protein 1 [Elsinoe australis]
MLDAQSSRLAHAWQNLQLLILSLLVLPASTALVSASLLIRPFLSGTPDKHRRHVRSTNTPYLQPRTILVTGVGMTKGLALARLFYAAGHNVIGADFEPSFLPTTCGRLSRSLKAFHKLHKPDGSIEGSARYAESLLNIIRKEKVDLWVSCSGVASAVEDGRAKEMIEAITPCKAIQYDVAMTNILHEKHTFIDFTRSIRLPVPETHNITSHAAASQILSKARSTGIKFIMKYTGTDDAFRANMTLLPLSTPAATEAYISRFPISPTRPWILQQFITGPEFCTHALIINNAVTCFVACPSSELLMHYTALPQSSALSRAMLSFTRHFVENCPDNFTGHLSFDFLIDQAQADSAARGTIDAEDVRLYPIECNPRAHTAVVLFADTPEMVSEGYMRIFDAPKEAVQSGKGQERKVNGTKVHEPVYPRKPGKYYWLPHDLVTLVLLPVLGLVSRDGTSVAKVTEEWRTFVEHVWGWKDGTFEIWDPLPAWWLWNISWPYVFLKSLVYGEKWSRVNVSTMKVFGC